ncbi:Uncharacterized protein TPAR_08083 [Tolypocladium paradoxum]|uniref:Uncharacterized protein n=1 Tax=Tolypocladium paradoxum TaxID=94208 RepID=A0A2S4KNG1_9HYPO|nr:Uncharacterized protein TPAR_08083 [Tolypocladium paradoxum]
MPSNNAHASPCCESVIRIARLYPRERLLVRPPLWTSRQLDLLDCHFEDSHDIHDIHDCDEVDETTPRPNLLLARAVPVSPVRLLAGSENIETKHYAAEGCLDFPGSVFRATGRKTATFRFARRAVEKLDCLVFSSREGVDDPCKLPQPRLAYLDYASIIVRRKHLLGPMRFHPGGGSNVPAVGLLRKRMAQVEPQDWSQDPFLVSVLISLAQAQQRCLVSRSASRGDSSPSTVESAIYVPLVLLTRSPDRYIHLYRADIPSAFLRKLDEPHHRPVATTRVTVVHSRIPFRPFKTFTSRLETELSRFQTVRLLEETPIPCQPTIKCAPGERDELPVRQEVVAHKRKRELESFDTCGNKALSTSAMGRLTTLVE